MTTIAPPYRPRTPLHNGGPVTAPSVNWADPRLSGRERQVLVAWLLGDSKGAASRELYVSSSTVMTHIARIRDKYAAVGRPAPTKAALLARALQDGLVTLDQF
ncbi:LuxR C-terminal-related transcriptional regulator [Nocardia cyriacigeorgica]|uniref:LuxR C-terminal-related transcriptional regulator n=1 Tax=Nocardia cyriacigeorgica TaxID=135487 RepID=UPI001E617C62|nr:LuxR C-terminal-related transcriptional regulator [Nocardia cyriacigeorgica]